MRCVHFPENQASPGIITHGNGTDRPGMPATASDKSADRPRRDGMRTPLRGARAGLRTHASDRPRAGKTAPRRRLHSVARRACVMMGARARSSVGSEYQATNLGVGGSNPSGRATLKAALPMRRRGSGRWALGTQRLIARGARRRDDGTPARRALVFRAATRRVACDKEAGRRSGVAVAASREPVSCGPVAAFSPVPVAALSPVPVAAMRRQAMPARPRSSGRCRGALAR